LLEVLVAIFITGVGLLALLNLFPLGVLEMARAVQDDRAEKLAMDSIALSRAGTDLLAETKRFIAAALARRSADPQTAARLRGLYEQLGVAASDLEARLIELRPLMQTRKLRRQFLASLTQIQGIQVAAARMVFLLRLLEQPNLPP
jgi:hypothetical protein